MGNECSVVVPPPHVKVMEHDYSPKNNKGTKDLQPDEIRAQLFAFDEDVLDKEYEEKRPCRKRTVPKPRRRIPSDPVVPHQSLSTLQLYGRPVDQIRILLQHLKHNLAIDKDMQFMVEWIRTHPAMDATWSESAMSMVLTDFHPQEGPAAVALVDALLSHGWRRDLSIMKWTFLTPALIECCLQHKVDVSDCLYSDLYDRWMRQRGMQTFPTGYIPDEMAHELSNLLYLMEKQTDPALWEPRPMPPTVRDPRGQRIEESHGLQDLLHHDSAPDIVIVESFRHWSRCYETWTTVIAQPLTSWPHPLVQMVWDYSASEPFLTGNPLPPLAEPEAERNEQDNDEWSIPIRPAIALTDDDDM